ncbi:MULTISPECIES: hypothetical protein [Arthrobacter]|uniref:DNA polymerase helix-hairpin-helix motif domain-containing protein n=2 Tax=Arthrobacter TaxID=1663 RepID=A0ABU9KR75_9MICC|nr:hypothetical protein [Arthrobacter sp. YJM1]MDP5228645.1 hypothetical protein [Arthrobacter sp. YJM1]
MPEADAHPDHTPERAHAVVIRDGLHGAVQHLGACQERDLPALLGASLDVFDRAVDDDGTPHSQHHGRVTVLAHGGGTAGTGTRVEPGAGYRALCRLVSEANGRRRGPDGEAPVGVSRQRLAAHAVDPETGFPVLTVLLGLDSDVGAAMHGPRYLRPRTLFKEWVAAMPSGTVAVELLGPDTDAGSGVVVSHAARLLKLAREHQVPAILRLGPPASSPTDDGERASQRVVAAAGLRLSDLQQLGTDRDRLRERCRLDPVRDVELRGTAPDTEPAEMAGGLLAALREAGIRCAPRAEEEHVPAIDVDARLMRQAYRVLARQAGKGRVALFGQYPEQPGPGTGDPSPEGLLPGGLVDSGDGSAAPDAPPAIGSEPLGIVLADGLADRVPLQRGHLGLPMSQYSRAELDLLGLFTVEIRGSREQSVIAYAEHEIERLNPGTVLPTVLDAVWLEEHHPAALLAGRCEFGDLGQEARQAEADRLGIELLPAHVVHSAVESRAVESQAVESRAAESVTEEPAPVRLGLGTIPGLSGTDAKRIVAGRPYASVTELLERAGLSRTALQRLAEAGAVRGLAGGEGPELARTLQGMDFRTHAKRPEQVQGQLSLCLGAIP